MAARCVPFALGSETWGSILTPAALCGVVGLRSTFGRVSRHGAMALAWSMDKIGPITRGAQDALIVLAAIAGHDPRDPSTIEGQPPLRPGRALSRKLRISLVLPEAMKKQDADVFAAHEAVAAELAKIAQIVPVQVPAPELPSDAVASLTVSVEKASVFEDLIDSGELAALESTDALATAQADRAIRAVDYLRAQRVRGKLRAAYARLFEKVDAVCTPALGFVAAVAPKLEDDLDAVFSGDDPFGSSGNLLGLPSIALPGPLVRRLPTGMQLVGPAWSEEALCSVADALERATPWAGQRPASAS